MVSGPRSVSHEAGAGSHTTSNRLMTFHTAGVGKHTKSVGYPMVANGGRKTGAGTCSAAVRADGPIPSPSRAAMGGFSLPAPPSFASLALTKARLAYKRAGSREKKEGSCPQMDGMDADGKRKGV